MRSFSVLLAAAVAAATPGLAQETPAQARDAGAARVRVTAPAREPGSRPRRARTDAVKLDPTPRSPRASGRASRVPSAPAASVAPTLGPLPRPAWRVAAGVPLTWRSASARPDSGLGLQFRTATPYAGVELEGQLFPQRALPSSSLPEWAEPIGLSVSLSHRVLTSRVGTEALGSREQRAALELLYEHHLPGRSARLTGRAGWAWHRFGVDESAVVRTVTHEGPRLGIDLAQPLHARVDAIGGVAVMPWAIVGGEERRARGEASEGWGTELLLGLGGSVPQARGLGWRLVYDYLRFSDRYAGAGTLSAGGSGAASHHAIVLGATWQR